MDICAASGVKFTQEEKTPEILSDKEIVSLFNERDEKAIEAVSSKYGNYCGAVVQSILKNPQDTEECLNDTWMRAWESIPPENPRNLGGFLMKLAKNISLNRFSYERAKKRGGGEKELPLVYDELSECTGCADEGSNVEKFFEQKLVTEAINDFLGTLPTEKRDIFVLRYWYCLPVKEIARKIGMKRSSVSATLMRTRRALAEYLEKNDLL